jgi:hypothetical protein
MASFLRVTLLIALGLCLSRPLAAQQAAAPRGFRGIELGMELDQVKERLARDALFDYRGDPDVSLLPTQQQTLIEVTGSSFIRRAFFQFHERKLYVLILVLDPQRLDYFTMYSTLTGKYGDCSRLDPTESVWEFTGLRLSLERPLSVKYLDTQVFAALREQGQYRQSLQEVSKQMFLEQF